MPTLLKHFLEMFPQHFWNVFTAFNNIVVLPGLFTLVKAFYSTCISCNDTYISSGLNWAIKTITCTLKGIHISQYYISGMVTGDYDPNMCSTRVCRFRVVSTCLYPQVSVNRWLYMASHKINRYLALKIIGSMVSSRYANCYKKKKYWRYANL